jgi:hypothetical protein
MGILAGPAAASAATADAPLELDLRPAQSSYGLDEPIRVGFSVTNTSGAPCGLARVAEGTVQVVSVRRDGQELVPVLGRSFYLDGIGSAIASGMVSTEPGSTVDVALVSVRVDDGAEPDAVVLRSVAAAPGGGGLDALWPVGAPGRYEVTASYAIPPVGGAVTPCAGATSAQTVEFTVGEVGSGLPWPWLLAGALLLVAAGVVIVIVLVRRRHRGAAAVALLLVGLIASVGTDARPAYADYTIDPNAGIPVDGVDFEAEVENCLQGFAAASGSDPDKLLPRLKDKKTPLVRIIPTTGGSGAFETPKSKNGPGSSTVTWNPTSVEPFGDGVARDPCASLYHELSHADDISKGTVPQGECGDTGIKTAEVKATLAENRYRESKGLPPREEYDGKKLPKSLDECKKPKKKAPPPKGPVRLCEDSSQCGSTNGDPHLVTFDRVYYDFQAVGEFIVIESTSGDPLEVQSRQAPMGPSRTVSVNSALAFQVGDRRVEMTIAAGVTQVRIDGEVAAVQPGERALPGGGALAQRESDLGAAAGYDVRWPDGSEAAVDQIGSYGYRLLLKLAQSRAGKVHGLLGNFDGDPVNDIAPRSGSPLPEPVSFEQLYPSYADSWRVKQEESLFHYASGHSTETFTDRSFPDRMMTLADLDPARRAQAEAACRWAGIGDPWMFNECVFDVGVTGRSEFAVSSASTELIAPPAAAPIAAAPIASGTLRAGSDDRLTFTGRDGGAVFVDITAPTLPNQCGPYRLLDPTGKQIGSGCNINGSGYIDRTELTIDGEYALVVEAGDGVSGPATMRVYAAKDSTGTIEANGADVAVTLEQPGSVATYRFTGAAGDRVFVEVPDSSLPDQCSPLQLRGGNGDLLASGCVINGLGDVEGTLLPADGVYTVVINPKDRTIGTVQMRLYAARDQSGTIAPNGPPVVATTGQPGLVIRYKFPGTAGTSVTLGATEATLPDQCSPLQLRDPADELLRSGCIINGVGGIDATLLPVTGTYTIVVDPSGTATGAVTLSLRS